MNMTLLDKLNTILVLFMNSWISWNLKDPEFLFKKIIYRESKNIIYELLNLGARYCSTNIFEMFH